VLWLVAGIVKLDDAGLYLNKTATITCAENQHSVGSGLLVSAPWLMKSLSVIGTVAMFMVRRHSTHASRAHDVTHGVRHVTAIGQP